MKISFVYADKPQELNTSIYRNVIPWMALKEKGYAPYLIPINLFEQNPPNVDEALGKSDIIVIERNLFGDVLTRIAYWIVRGKIIVANYDDFYEGIEETNASYSFWKKGEVTYKVKDYEEKSMKSLFYHFPVNGNNTIEKHYVPHFLNDPIEIKKMFEKPKYYQNKWHDKNFIPYRVATEKEKMITKVSYPHPLWQFKLGLKMVHAQIMPSKHLMRKYKSHSPTYYIPNYFITQNYVNVPKDKRDYLVIGWGGSMSHIQSFKDSGVIKAVENIVNSRDDVKFMIVGDMRVLNVINIPNDKKLFHPYVKNEDWGAVLSKNFDIGIAPLEGEYDKCRSIIKPIEYMLTKTPFVASYGEAYKELAGIGGLGNFVKNSVANWETKLRYIIDNYETEKEKMKGKPFEYAMTWDYLSNVEYMVDTYKKISREQGKKWF